MLYSNTYELNLTGTNFGLLSTYPKTEYFDGYFFNDLFGSANINYSNTVSGNVFLSAATTAFISAMPGLLVWLDTSDTSKILTGIGGLTGLRDKSPFNRLFIANTPIPIVNWPLSGGYNNTLSAIHIQSTQFLYNSTFCLSLTSPFTLFFVWKELNYYTANDNYPLCLLTEYQQTTGEIVLINNYESKKAIWGYRDSTYSVVITGIPFKDLGENYFVWTHVGQQPINLSSTKLEVFNESYSATDFFYISAGPALNVRATTIGSLCGEDINSFIFGEMLLFNRVISGVELVDIKNAINKKWNFYEYYKENVSFNETVTGGPLSSTSYEDYSLLTSKITLPIQDCVTLLSINLSGFDITMSNISKIVYDYKGELKEISSNLVFKDNDIVPVLSGNKINLVLFPSKDEFVSTYNIRLSVYRFDSTVNKLHLSGNILKCNVLDYFEKSNLLDSQVINNSREVLIVTENQDKNLLFLNKLDVTLPPQALSGGEVRDLINDDISTDDDVVVLLSELLDETSATREVFKVPIIPPLPRPRINPILPN